MSALPLHLISLAWRLPAAPTRCRTPVSALSPLASPRHLFGSLGNTGWAAHLAAGLLSRLKVDRSMLADYADNPIQPLVPEPPTPPPSTRIRLCPWSRRANALPPARQPSSSPPRWEATAQPPKPNPLFRWLGLSPQVLGLAASDALTFLDVSAAPLSPHQVVHSPCSNMDCPPP